MHRWGQSPISSNLPTDQASVVFNQASDGAYAGIISSTGSITKSGAGTLSLSGTKAFTGGTTISAGTLQLGADNAAGTGPVAVDSAGTFDLNGFTQSVGGDLAGMTLESLRTSLGTRLSRQFQTGSRAFTPNVSAAWEHEYKDQGRSIDAQFASGAGNAFTVQTSEAGRDAAVMGVGCSLQWTSALSLTVDYSGEVGRTHFYSHTFNGGVRYRF